MIISNSDFNSGDNNDNENSNINTSTTIGASNEDTLTSTTRAISVLTIVLIVFLVVQVIVLATLLIIWLRKRNRQRAHERQRMEESFTITPYLRPSWSWSSPSHAQQTPQKIEQYGQSLWQQASSSSSPNRFLAPDTASQAAPNVAMASRFNNRETLPEFAIIGRDRREMPA
ncbi:hypothetical protein GGR51DRAFT_504809 [Nemania sp. FL0031]|nr:hypothetical protein GGR51DRAFT_504809 [Nemania sp. FL0031]